MQDKAQMTTNDMTSIQAIPASDLAQRLGVSLRHIRRMDAMGKLPQPVRIGNSVRWVLSEIQEWLASGCPDRRLWQAKRGKTNG